MNRRSHQVEISEIHISSMFSDRDVRVMLGIRGAGKKRYSTKVIRQSHDSFIRFEDTFVLDVQATDPALMVVVCEGSASSDSESCSKDALAHLELPVQELLTLAKRRHREFYRAELAMSTDVLVALGGEVASRRPYAAMRLRDVSPRA